MTVVCTEAYSCKEPNHLNLQPGDIIEGIPRFDLNIVRLFDHCFDDESKTFSYECQQ